MPTFAILPSQNLCLELALRSLCLAPIKAGVAVSLIVTNPLPLFASASSVWIPSINILIPAEVVEPSQVQAI